MLRVKKGEKEGQRGKKSEKRVKKIPGCKENRALLDFSCIFSVAFPLEFLPKFNSLSNALGFRTVALILKELCPFWGYALISKWLRFFINRF